MDLSGYNINSWLSWKKDMQCMRVFRVILEQVYATWYFQEILSPVFAFKLATSAIIVCYLHNDVMSASDHKKKNWSC